MYDQYIAEHFQKLNLFVMQKNVNSKRKTSKHFKFSFFTQQIL